MPEPDPQPVRAGTAARAAAPWLLLQQTGGLSPPRRSGQGGPVHFLVERDPGRAPLGVRRRAGPQDRTWFRPERPGGLHRDPGSPGKHAFCDPRRFRGHRDPAAFAAHRLPRAAAGPGRSDPDPWAAQAGARPAAQPCSAGPGRLPGRHLHRHRAAAQGFHAPAPEPSGTRHGQDHQERFRLRPPGCALHRAPGHCRALRFHGAGDPEPGNVPAGHEQQPAAAGRILNANQQACAVLGYSREELLNLDSFELDPSLEDADALEHFWNRLKLKTSLSFESRHKRKDGSTFPVELRIALLELEDQEVALATARDISDRKQAEQEKALLEEQLRQAQKMEAVGKLAGGIAHDFNNLLQALSGKIQLMLHSSAHRLTQTQYFLELDRITQRASRLVTQLLTFSRRSSPELQEVDLNQEIQETLGLLERTIPKMISLETDLSPSIGKFLADPMQIEQVLMNLINNAVDALPRGGEISLSTSRVELDAPDHATLQPGPYARLCVADNGLGMEQDVLEHIFEPFFTTKPVGEGTGLGLPVSRQIVTAFGGRLELAPSRRGGATFLISLPMAPRERQPDS
ncbi:MAG: two-component system sensor histidine kinase NtrB [Desulfohalobiaceae bacterium]